MPKPRRRVSSLTKRLASQHAAGLDTAPLERFGHGQELAPQSMTRAPHQIASTVETLYQARRISDPERNAADRFRRDYTLGILGARTATSHVHAGPDALHTVMLARAASVTAHRAIATLLGRELTTLAIAAIVDDLTFRALDRLRGGGNKEISGQVQAMLQVLPGLYQALDRRRKGDQRTAA